MKTLEQIDKLLMQFEKRFGLEIRGAQQGSEIWMLTKLGVLSASNAKVIVSKGEGRLTYMANLVAQIATGVFPEVNSKHMDWGKDHEDAARSAYMFATGYEIVEASFVFGDENFREGCSPDFLIPSMKKGAEIKCPWNTENYIKFLCEDKLKSDWLWQAQFQMRVLDAESWDFVQYDPRMKKNPLTIRTIERDPEMQDELDEAIPKFVSDMDKMLKKAGFEFGEQWARIGQAEKARTAWGP